MADYTMAAGYVSVATRAEREAGLHRVQEHRIARTAYRNRWSLEGIFRDYAARERPRRNLARLMGRLEQFDAVLVHGTGRLAGTGIKTACEEEGVRVVDVER